MSELDKIRARIEGPVYSVITPFREKDDEIDFDVLGAYLQRIYDGGGRMFYVMGYNSRFSELSWEEIKVLNTFVTRTLKDIDPDNLVIVADPLHCSTAVSADFARHAENVGADMISLVFREKYYSDDQVFKHFDTVANATGIGVLIHEMPFTSGHGGHQYNYPVSLLDRLAGIDNVIAIKEDAKEDDYSHEVISTIKDRLAIIISGGGKRQWLKFADLGCQAWLNGIGVFEPRLAMDFWKAHQAGDMEFRTRIIDEIEVPFFEQVVAKYGWHLGIKAAMQARGVMNRYERMPMLAITDDEYAGVKALMDKLPIDELVYKA